MAFATGNPCSNACAAFPTLPLPRRESTDRCWSRAALALASRSSRASSPTRSGRSAACSAQDLEPEARSKVAQPVPGEAWINAPYPALVLGKNLAETIGAQVGDSVLVTSPQGELTPLGLAPKYQRFRVAAIFQSGFYQYDSAMAFMRLSEAQRLFSEPDLLFVISFKVDDLDRAPAIGRAIEHEAGRGFMTS